MSRNDSADGFEDSLVADTRFDDLRGVPWLGGVAAGTVAWVVGYLLMSALFYVGPASIVGDTHLQRLRNIGMVFYNAHLVDGVAMVSGETARLNVVIEQTGTNVPMAVYFAIPVVTLLVAGLLVGYVLLGSEPEIETPGLVGLAMAGGYLVPAVALTFLVELPVVSLAGVVILQPDRLQTVAFCVAFPFVLGTIGALVETVVDR